MFDPETEDKIIRQTPMWVYWIVLAVAGSVWGFVLIGIGALAWKHVLK